MVLYFTGTGNSRYLARRIAEGLEMSFYDLNTCIKAGDTTPVQTGQDVGGSEWPWVNIILSPERGCILI